MDFRGMKRKQLQALCKQHGVPANSTNLEMADRLSLLFKEKEKSVTQGRSCLKNLDGIDSLNDSNAVTCEPKRVRFSPENETFEFEDSEIDRENTPARTRAARAARRSRARLAKEKGSPVGANAGNSESCEETKSTLNRITRHQGQKVIEGHAVKASSPLVKEKRAKKGTKIKSTVAEIVDKSAKLSPILEMDDNARGKENGRPIRRQLRSREVVVENASELGNEDSIIPKKNPVQTRSKKRNPKDSNEVLTTDEISEDIISAGEGEKIETGKVFRQSKRKAIEDGKCELFGGELGKRKMVGRITRFRAQLVEREASAVEGENETGDESEVQVSKDSEAVLQVEEPAKFLGRNTLRQKSAISQSDPSARTETRKQWKGTRLEGGASETEVSMKEKEKVSLPNGPLRRSRRNNSAFKSTVSPDGGLVTHEAVGRNQQLKHLGEPITEKEASKPEASAEILKENEKVSLHNGRLRRSRCNTSTFKSSAPAADGNLVTDETVGRNEQSKCLRESTPEKEASVTEAPLRRSKRNASRHDSISASTGMDGIPNAIGKNKPQKRRLQPILEEETSVIEKEPLIEELPRQSKYNASKCNIVGPARVAGEVKGKKKQWRRSKFPSSKGEAPLTESMLDTEETPGIDVELSEPEAAGSKSSVLIHQEGTPKDKDTSKKRKSSRKISSAKKQQHGSVEVCPVISDLEEVEDRTTVNFKDIPSQSAAAIEEDIVEDLTTVNLEDIPSQSAVAVEEDISMENDKENLVQDKVNEGNKVDKESQFHNMRRYLDYDNSVEPQGNQYSSKVSKELVSPVFDFSSVQQPDYTGSSANHANLQRELETEEKLSAGKHIDPVSDILVDLAAEDDKTSVEKEQKLGLEEMNGCAEPVMHELEENVTESNESGSSKRNFETFSEESGDIASLSPSNGERATPNISGRRDIDDAEDPEAAAEFPENVLASPVATAEIVAEKVTEIQLASSGQWSTEETPLKIVITPECQMVGSCLHTVSADDGSQEEGYQLNAQLAAQSPLLGRSNPNHGEGEKSYSYGNVIMDGTMCGGELSVSDARERREHSVLDELDSQISEKKESVMSKGITSISKEIKETDVSHLHFLFGTASGIDEKSMPSCEHTHLKDKSEEDQDPMEQDEESTHVTEMASTTISAGKTSSNNLGSGRFHHEKYQEDAGVGESDNEGISNMGNQSLDVNEDIYNEASKGNLEVEFTGLDGCAYPFPNKFSKDDHATVDNESGGSHVYSRNASGEGRGTNVVELLVGEGMPPGVSIMDKTGNASGEVEGTNVDEPSVEGITPAILEERVTAETRDFEEADKLLEFNAESHVTPGSTVGDMEKEIHFAETTQCSGGSGFDPPLSHVYALEHQASGNVHKEMSLSTQSPHVQKQEGNQLETFCVNEVLSQQTSEDYGGVKSFTLEALAMSSPPLFLEKLYGHEEEDSEMNCNANTVVDEPFSKHSVVTLDGIDGKGIEEHICVTSSNPVTKKESAEVLPEIEVGNVHDDHHVVVEQMDYNVDASSAERNCKDNKMSDEAIAGFSRVGHVTLVPGEKISEFVPGTELGDSQEVTAQANINFDVSLDEIICKESEALEKTTAGIKKSTLEGVEEFNMLEEENGEISAPITQTKLDREVLDQGVEFVKINGSAQVTLVETVHENDEVPEEILDEVTSEKMILLPMEADFDCNEMKNVVGVKNEISLQRDELKSIDLNIHDAKDKSIFINSDQCSSADRETIDEREHSRILECKFNFEGNCSGTKHTDVGASPLISLKDFDDQIEDKEVAHMHDSDHCLSLDLLSNNRRIVAKKTHKTIAESVMLESEKGEAFTPVGSEGLGQEVSDHGVEFPNSAASDVSQAVHEADENLDTKSDGGVEMIWQGDEVKFGELDDPREEVLPETDKSSLIVPHELTSTDGEAVNGTMKENSHFEDVNFDSMKEEDVSNSPKVTAGNCVDLLEEESADVKHNGRDVQIDLNCRDIGGAADLVVEDGMVCEIGSDDRNGDTMWVQKAQTSPCKVDDGNISSSKPEGDSISASVSLLNVSSYQVALEHETLVCDTTTNEFCSGGTNSVLRDGRGNEAWNSTFRISEINSIFEDIKDAMEVNENVICTEQSAKECGKHDHHMVEAEVAELNGNQLAFSTEPIFEDGDALRDQRMATTTTEDVDCENEKNEINRNNTSCVFAHSESLADIFEVNDSGHATSDEHTAEVASRKHLTRLEDTTDDSSLTHQIGVNSSLASSETASYEFTDWEIDLFSHNHFSMKDERVAIRSGRHEETGAAVEKEAVSGTSLRIIDQFPAVTDSALYKAKDVRTEYLKLETVQKKSLDVEVEEINHLSSQQFNSSMKMKKNLKSSMTQRTPNKFFKASDMKENTPSIKMEQMGNFSAMKSGTRRKALEDLQKTRERNSTAR